MTISPVLYSSGSEEYITPKALFEILDEYYHFTLDPCTTPENPLKVPNFYTKEQDGLKQNWDGRVYMNPPYGRQISKWIAKAWDEIGYNKNCELIIALLPARTDTNWFHDYIYNFEHTEYIFLRGRLRFENTQNSAPFPSMVVLWNNPHSSFIY